MSPFGEVRLDPLVGRRLDQVHDREQRGVDLLARLQRVAAVDEQRGAVRQHDRGAGRAGEAGQPGEPLLGRRHIFALVAVGVRHDEAGRARAAPVRRAAPRRAARSRAGSAASSKVWNLASNMGVNL